MANEIIFTLGRLGEIRQFEEYRPSDAYERYAAAYIAISETLNSITENVLAGELNTILKAHIDEGAIERYIDEYEKYLYSINEIVDRSGLAFQEVDITSFLESARNYVLTAFNRSPYQQNVMMLQFVSVTSQIVEFLHHIEEAVTHHSPIFKYMEIGASILKYTDRKMFRKMYNAMRSVGDDTIAKSILKVSLRNNSALDCHSYHYYGERVAMADYSYSFKTKYKPVVLIEPVDLGNSMLSTNYKTNNCSMKLGLGQQIALFKTPGRKENTVLSFAGTQMFGGRTPNNLYTDICQIVHGPETSYLAAVGVLSEVANTVGGQIRDARGQVNGICLN